MCRGHVTSDLATPVENHDELASIYLDYCNSGKLLELNGRNTRHMSWVMADGVVQSSFPVPFMDLNLFGHYEFPFGNLYNVLLLDSKRYLEIFMHVSLEGKHVLLCNEPSTVTLLIYCLL